VAKAARLYGWRAEMSLRDGLEATRQSVIAARTSPAARPPGAFSSM
jgi:hypothetical protein